MEFQRGPSWAGSAHLRGALGDPERAPLAVAAGRHVPRQSIHALLHIPIVLHAYMACQSQLGCRIERPNLMGIPMMR